MKFAEHALAAELVWAAPPLAVEAPHEELACFEPKQKLEKQQPKKAQMWLQHIFLIIDEPSSVVPPCDRNIKCFEMPRDIAHGYFPS